jgi:hypothetical protein
MDLEGRTLTFKEIAKFIDTVFIPSSFIRRVSEAENRGELDKVKRKENVYLLMALFEGARLWMYAQALSIAHQYYHP